MAVLDRECGGRKTDQGIATLIYSRTSRVELTDESKVLLFLLNDIADFFELCYNYKDG